MENLDKPKRGYSKKKPDFEKNEALALHFTSVTSTYVIDFPSKIYELLNSYGMSSP